MGNIYAYGRLAPDNSEKEFLTAVGEMQVPEGNVYTDYRDKKRRTFPEYARLLKRLERGDLLYISGLSSLGDSYAEVKDQWWVLTKEKKADVILLDMPTVDTRKGKAQYGLLVADVVYSLLDYITDNDNNVRRSRQREGIAEAREKGIKFGRPPKQMPDDFFQIYNRWVAREITAVEAAKLCKVSRTVFYRKVKEVRGSLGEH